MKVGLIVDGDSEKIALPTQILANTVIRKSLNGKNVSLGQIANNAIKLAGALSAVNCTHIILILDREKRSESAYDIKQALIKSIGMKCGLNFGIVVADRMFENWLLADIENISTKFPAKFNLNSNGAFESTHGKNEIRKMTTPNYSLRTDDAGEFFKKIRTSVGVTNSASFSDWIKTLETLTIKYINRS